MEGGGGDGEGVVDVGIYWRISRGACASAMSVRARTVTHQGKPHLSPSPLPPSSSSHPAVDLNSSLLAAYLRSVASVAWSP